MLYKGLTVYFCRNCFMEIYDHFDLRVCPFCGEKLQRIGHVKEEELEEEQLKLGYELAGKFRKKFKLKELKELWGSFFDKMDIEQKKEFFKNEIGEIFETMDEEEKQRCGLIWYDSTTTLYEELIIRFEMVFGEIKE